MSSYEELEEYIIDVLGGRFLDHYSIDDIEILLAKLILEQTSPSFVQRKGKDILTYPFSRYLNFRGRKLLRDINKEPFDEIIVNDLLPKLLRPAKNTEFMNTLEDALKKYL